MAPGHVPGVADQDQRHAEQARAGDVDLPRNGELGLVEALGAVPREVRVAEQHPASVVGGLRAQRHGVGADPAEGKALLELLEHRGPGGGRHRRAGRRCRPADPVDGDALAGEQGQLVEAPVGLGLGDRMHPRLAAAGGIGQVVHPGVGEVAVIAGDVAADDLAHLRPRPLRRRLGQEPLDHVVVDDALEEEVAVEVVRGRRVGAKRPRGVGTEVPRALGVDRHVGVGDLAQVVLGEGVAVAVAQPAPVRGEHVRDAVGGAPDGGVVRIARRRARAGRSARGEQRGERQSDAKRPPAHGAHRLLTGAPRIVAAASPPTTQSRVGATLVASLAIVGLGVALAH